MIILKIIACAFSMGFCFISVLILADLSVELFFAAFSDRYGYLSEWLQERCIYFVVLWIFFCGICVILAEKLKDFDRLVNFFVNLFLPTVAIWIISPFLGITIAVAFELHGGDILIGICTAYVLALIVVAEVLEQVYPPKT